LLLLQKQIENIANFNSSEIFLISYGAEIG